MNLFLGFQSTTSLPNGIIEEGIGGANSLEKFPWFKNISRKRAEKLIKEGKQICSTRLSHIQFDKIDKN